MTDTNSVVKPTTDLETLISGLAQAHCDGDKELDIMKTALSVAVEHLANSPIALKDIALKVRDVLGNDVYDPCYEECIEDLAELNAYCELEASAPITILDTTIYDWHMTELGDDWEAPEAHKLPYRFLIEQSPVSKQVWFKLYPKTLDAVSTELPRHGLAGIIEVRNGHPAMCLGIDENDVCVAIESAANGLFIHHPHECRPRTAMFKSFDHGMSFPANLYPCGDTSWVSDAQQEIARHSLSCYDFSGRKIEKTASWQQSNSEWSTRVTFESAPTSSEKYQRFVVRFFDQSVCIDSMSLA